MPKRANRFIPLAIILFFVFLVALSYYSATSTPKRAPTTAMTYDGIGLKPRGPGQPKWDMYHKKFTSLETAKEYMSPNILFPSYTAGRDLGIIWIEETKARNKRAVIAMYEKGLQVNAIPLNDEDGQAYLQNFATDKRSIKLTVHGMVVYGVEPSEPGEYGPRGQPGYVSWWENGVSYIVGGEGLPVEQLLKIAESTKLQ